MHTPLYDRLERELTEREADGLLRRIPEHAHHSSIDLSTNSYCALHANETVAEAARHLAGGILCGNLASRLIAETSPLAHAVESELAAWKHTEAALLFNSGYAANVGVLQALCTRDTEVFCDRLNHASIIDGILLSGAKLSRYRHCDMIDLRERVAASVAREKLIVTDTVFSMDGDCAPLAAICEIAASDNCTVMVDEAHATGIFGANASGLVEALGVADAVDIRIGTLSKAIAGLGGFFCGSTLMRDYLINSARSFIYSTALPHPVIAFDLASICFIRAHPELGKQLLVKAQDFRSRIGELGFNTLASTTQIIPILTGDDSSAIKLMHFLRERGIIAPAIRPPTVPKNTARIRFSVHLGLTKNQEEQVFSALREWKTHHD